MKKSTRRQPRGQLWVEYGEHKVSFALHRSQRKTLAISVDPDGSVTVTAPVERDIEEIRYFVRKRARWIVRQQRQFSKFHPLPTERQYVSGETHRFLGRQYRLKVIECKQSDVKLKGKFIYVSTPNKADKMKIKAQLEAWYRLKAMILLPRRLEGVLQTVSSLKLPTPTIRYRRMAMRWGSCAKSGTITLNTELVKAPLHCIDYVIAHELCHLRHRDHSPAFWRLLSGLMPDWETRKARMERVVI